MEKTRREEKNHLHPWKPRIRLLAKKPVPRRGEGIEYDRLGFFPERRQEEGKSAPAWEPAQRGEGHFVRRLYPKGEGLQTAERWPFSRGKGEVN